MFIRLHLANIGCSVRLRDLEAFCLGLRQLIAIDMPLDRDTGHSSGFAFLTFATADAARTGLGALHGRQLAGQAIRAQLLGEERG